MHYYTIRNRVTGEKSLVHARGRGVAMIGFAKRRLDVQFTSQQELLDLTAAGVPVLDLTRDQASAPQAAPLPSHQQEIPSEPT